MFDHCIQLFDYLIKSGTPSKYYLPPSPTQLTSLPVSTLNTIHHSRLTVCQALRIWPAAYRFCFDKRLWISWFPRLRFCGHSRNLEFTITISKGLGLIFVITVRPTYITVFVGLDSSVGRALDWRSKGPRFNPGSGQKTRLIPGVDKHFPNSWPIMDPNMRSSLHLGFTVINVAEGFRRRRFDVLHVGSMPQNSPD